MSMSSGVPSVERTCSFDIPALSCDTMSCDTKLPCCTSISYGVTPGMRAGHAAGYRVLTQFGQAGLLARQHFETGKAVFELNHGGHHDHLLCLQCGRVEEFYDSEIEKRQTDVARQRGFQLHGHSLALYADCIKQDCPYRPT